MPSSCNTTAKQLYYTASVGFNERLQNTNNCVTKELKVFYLNFFSDYFFNFHGAYTLNHAWPFFCILLFLFVYTAHLGLQFFSACLCCCMNYYFPMPLLFLFMRAKQFSNLPINFIFFSARAK